MARHDGQALRRPIPHCHPWSRRWGWGFRKGWMGGRHMRNLKGAIRLRSAPACSVLRQNGCWLITCSILIHQLISSAQAPRRQGSATADYSGRRRSQAPGPGHHHGGPLPDKNLTMSGMLHSARLNPPRIPGQNAAHSPREIAERRIVYGFVRHRPHSGTRGSMPSGMQLGHDGRGTTVTTVGGGGIHNLSW